MQYKKNKGEVIQISNRHLMIRDTKLINRFRWNYVLQVLVTLV